MAGSMRIITFRSPTITTPSATTGARCASGTTTPLLRSPASRLIRTATDTGIDAVEALVRGLFRIGKRTTARIDEFAADLIGAGERTAAGVFKGLRDTTRAAGELATTAAGAIIGSDRPAAQA